jgi:hypothetical protein
MEIFGRTIAIVRLGFEAAVPDAAGIAADGHRQRINDLHWGLRLAAHYRQPVSIPVELSSKSPIEISPLER